MNESTGHKAFDKPICLMCGAPRQDPSLTRCENCGADLTSVKAIEDFVEALLLDARGEIRNRRYTEARTKLEIASWMDEATAEIAKLIGTEILENEHRYAEALENYEEALRKGVNTSKWGINLEEKVAKLKEKLDLENAAKEHFNLALHRSREGYFAEAREELYKAADLASYLPEIYLLAAKVDLALGAETAMYDDIIRYRQLRPDDPRGEQMMKELERRKVTSRLQMDQILFAVCFMVFSVAVIVLIALIR